MTVFPRSAGTFLMSRSEISLKEAAVSRMLVISAAGTPSSPSRCRCVNAMLTLLTLRSRSRRWPCGCAARGRRRANGCRPVRGARCPCCARGSRARYARAHGGSRLHPSPAGCHWRSPVASGCLEASAAQPGECDNHAEPFLTSLGQVKRCRTVFGSRPYLRGRGDAVKVGRRSEAPIPEPRDDDGEEH